LVRARHQDHPEAREQGLELAREIDAAPVREQEIDQQRVWAPGDGETTRVADARGSCGLEPGLLEHTLEQGPDGIVVFDDQHLQRFIPPGRQRAKLLRSYRLEGPGGLRRTGGPPYVGAGVSRLTRPWGSTSTSERSRAISSATGSWRAPKSPASSESSSRSCARSPSRRTRSRIRTSSATPCSSGGAGLRARSAPSSRGPRQTRCRTSPTSRRGAATRRSSCSRRTTSTRSC